MLKNGNVMQLSALLQGKVESDRQQIEQQTSEQLKLHAETLQRLSSAALSTTQSAIQQQQQALNKNLIATRKAIQQQNQTLTTEIQQQTNRLFRLMKLPLLAALIVCLILCFAIWGWYQINTPWQILKTPSGQQFLTLKGEWTSCTINKKVVPCQPIN